MRRIITLLVAIATITAAVVVPTQRVEAQSTISGFATLQRVEAGDTLVNTDTLVKVYRITDGYSGVTITPVVIKLGGTVAGKFTVYTSSNGTDYTPKDSLTLANVPERQFKEITLTAPVPVYIRTTYITSGTQSYKTEHWLLVRRYRP